MNIPPTDFDRLRGLAFDNLINLQNNNSVFGQRYATVTKEHKKEALAFAYTRMYVGKLTEDK